MQHGNLAASISGGRTSGHGSTLPDYDVELLVHYGDEESSRWKAYTLKVNRKGIRKVLLKKKIVYYRRTCIYRRS